MQKDEIILRISNERISLNSLFSVPIQQTNIPHAPNLRFRTHQEIFWRVEIIGYEQNSKCLKVKVQDYKPDDISSFEIQKFDEPVDQILFDKLDWGELEPQLSIYKRKELLKILTNLEADPFSKAQLSLKATLPPPKNKPAAFPLLQLKTISDEFWISFNDLHFKLGYVTFKKQVKGVFEELDFLIMNEHILPEFDNVKSWFSKRLKTKRIKVSASIDLRNYEVTGHRATSVQIDQITPELIDSIKYQRALSITKRGDLNSPDKALFTHEEILSRIEMGDVPGSTLNPTEDDILSILREKGEVRNKKQLAYLAERKQAENHKLYYTLRPNFGFMFFIEGRSSNHFVWELLDSNATYIWSFHKTKGEVESQFKRMHTIINTIRTSGRNNYKEAYSSGRQDNDLVFKSISHDNISSDSIEAFPTWRKRLNEQLT
jgi:hypothetical protein